jgi:tryptophan synthase alpha chain
MGLLVYANLVEARGQDGFYTECARVGVDSVLVADVPTVEVEPYVRAATAHGVDPVLIATPNASETALADIARLGRGYTYVVTRSGVTGTSVHGSDQRQLVQRLGALGAAPCVLGFGISEPAHVRAAIRGGAAGAISGSAVVAIIARHLGDDDTTSAELSAFTARMKAATQ